MIKKIALRRRGRVLQMQPAAGGESRLRESFLLYRKLLSYGFGNENSPLEKRALEIDVSDLENIESFFIKIVLIDIIEFM